MANESFSPAELPNINGVVEGFAPKLVPQQLLKGGWKETMNSNPMASTPNSVGKNANVYLQRGIARSLHTTAERSILQPSKRSQHPVINAVCGSETKPSTPSCGETLLTASQKSSTKKKNDGVWEQGKSAQPSKLTAIDIIEGEESLSVRYGPHSRTYGRSIQKVNSEGSVMTNFDKVVLKSIKTYTPDKSPMTQLTLNPSVTVTAISAPVTAASPLSFQRKIKSSTPTSASCSSFLNNSFCSSPLFGNSSQNSSLPSSSRKLDFGPSNCVKKANFGNIEDSDPEIFSREPLRVKKMRTPFKPVLKSSLLNGISPNKIERAYGEPSSSPEKENVPIVKEEEETRLQPHLLGFPNLGNTCYLNAVLQSLVSMRVFRLDVRRFVQHLPPPADSLLYGLTSILEARKTGRPSSLKRPLRLVKEIFEKLDSSFMGWKMQDANEFLTKVLDTIKDEVDKLLAEEIHKSKKQKPTLPFSPIQNSAPRLLNKSVVIRSLSPGEAAVAYKSIDDRRGQKRSLSSENLSQTGINAANGSDSGNDYSFRLVLIDSDDSLSEYDCSPPRPKFSKVSSKIDTKNSIKMKDLGEGASLSHLNGSGLRAHKDSNANKRSSMQQQSPFLKKSPQPNHRTCKDNWAQDPIQENDVSANPITANFGFHLQEVYTCLGCNARVQRSQEYFSLYLHLASCEMQDSSSPSSIRAAVAEYMKQEQRDLKCELCSHPTACVTTTFTKMPRIMIIQMKRYTFDAAEFSSLKVCSSIEVNKILDLSSYTGSSVRCYPSLATSMLSAPSTPVKAPLPPAHRVFGGARAEVLRSSSSEPNSGEVLGGNTADVADNTALNLANQESTETKSLSEDEQIQEALRRSLEDAAVVPTSGGDDSTPVVLSNVDKEEDDLMKAIRLSLLEAQERERIRVAEEEAVLKQSAARVAQVKEHSREDLSVPDEEDECVGAHSYRLASIVSHYGRNTTAGHYVCDVVNERSDLWLHYDDECVTEVPISEVLGPSRQRNGYIFFYIHKDLLSASSQAVSS
ncbi:Peptidase C19 ubiquitin carboxyl-terminal hydrolase [Trinorchestia longiramus]|nr:Peptidase C19 ubiquitin carboxyl-terminal hydrolase [Trinorchestia longiramus]